MGCLACLLLCIVWSTPALYLSSLAVLGQEELLCSHLKVSVSLTHQSRSVAMYRKRAAETRGPSAPLSLAACCCALLVAALCAPMSAVAYNVRYSALISPSPVSGRSYGYCPWQGGGHTMMPMKESFQVLAFEALSKRGFTEAAIGGWCPYASCTTNPCEWVYFTGLMNGTDIKKATFFRGAVYKSKDYTHSVPGMYNNFLKGYQPVSFDRAKERTITKMVSNGRWENEMRDHGYQDWVCEYYEFTPEEAATAPVTDENGFVIFVSRTKPGKFPWWAGLLIALLIVGIVAVVLLICCCCRRRRKQQLENKIAEEMKSEENLHRIPTQSQLGMSRSGSAMNLSRRGSAMNLSRRGSAMNLSRRGSAMNLSRSGSAMNLSRRGSAKDMSRRGSSMGLNRGGSNRYGEIDVNEGFGMGQQMGYGPAGVARNNSAYVNNVYPGDAGAPGGNFFFGQFPDQGAQNPYAGYPPQNGNGSMRGYPPQNGNGPMRRFPSQREY
ncbi:uncharacterized protein Tco025E_02864 [Trypanosoma conorhini]|uniref:Uncharacterized protein n=1 Tax=Trypanosoma conorhini TaxID=83891 RepID=A0A3R7LYI1_9TRYP|nr:uncharacterized protein Tco025E_02864 [Trypanosoma conorhini]RNF23170.1 hypothetical protein Tco025E_02864 [Trypanosoma conorhini]